VIARHLNRFPSDPFLFPQVQGLGFIFWGCCLCDSLCFLFVFLQAPLVMTNSEILLLLQAAMEGVRRTGSQVVAVPYTGDAVRAQGDYKAGVRFQFEKINLFWPLHTLFIPLQT
jgi:hypothetical protein